MTHAHTEEESIDADDVQVIQDEDSGPQQVAQALDDSDDVPVQMKRIREGSLPELRDNP